MLNKMFIFEWRYFTKQPSFYISLLIFFAVAFITATVDKISMGGGNILKNGPYSIMFIMLIMGLFSMFLVVNIVASTALRNQTGDMSEIIFSKPINPTSYQLGRL